MRRLFEAPPLRGVPIVAIGIPADDELDVEEDSEHEPRRARLGAESVELMGAAPVPGDLLRGPFAVPPARCADGPL